MARVGSLEAADIAVFGPPHPIAVRSLLHDDTGPEHPARTAVCEHSKFLDPVRKDQVVVVKDRDVPPAGLLDTDIQGTGSSTPRDRHDAEVGPDMSGEGVDEVLEVAKNLRLHVVGQNQTFEVDALLCGKAEQGLLKRLSPASLGTRQDRQEWLLAFVGGWSGDHRTGYEGPDELIDDAGGLGLRPDKLQHLVQRGVREQGDVIRREVLVTSPAGESRSPRLPATPPRVSPRPAGRRRRMPRGCRPAARPS